MNKTLKKTLVTSAALLMLASIGAGLNANASHNVGWRQISREANLKINRSQRIHLRKNQRVYVIKLARNKKSAEIKIGRNYYNLSTKLLKRANYRKAIKRYQKSTRRINKRHARKYAKKRQRNAKRVAKQANRKRARNHKRINKKHVKTLKARYRTSNNRKLLKRSGFVNLQKYGPDFFNKFAPNDKRAVVPKKLNVKKMIWLQGHLLQKNPPAYAYDVKTNGWVKLAKK